MINKLKKISENIYELPKQGKMNVPVIVYASEKLLKDMQKDRCLEQAKNVAMLPGIQEKSIVLPDSHQGYGFPIGGVAAFDIKEGIISPGGVGYDINCLSKDSRVLTDIGYWKKISDFKDLSKNEELSILDMDNCKINRSKINLFMKKPSEKIIKLKTESGFEIMATDDHPFYTKDGMKKISEIKDDEVLIYPFEGVEYEIPDKKLLVDENDIDRLNLSFTSKLQIKKKLNSLGLLPLYSDNDKLPYILKIMGFVFGDGTLNIGKNKQIGFYGGKNDLELIKNDLEKIGFKSSLFFRKRHFNLKTQYKEYSFSRDQYSLKSNSSSLAILLYLLGTPEGNKAEKDYNLPDWIVNLKKWQKRLFIASLFGAELSSPKSITNANLNLYGLVYSINKRNQLHGINFVNQISSILDEFEIKNMLIKSREDELNGTKSTRIRLLIGSSSTNLIRFFSQISYEYNSRKRNLANAAIVWLRQKNKIIEIRNDSKIKAKEMKEKGHSKKQIIGNLANKYVNESFLEKAIYYDDYGKSGSRVAYCFITFDEFVKQKCHYESGFIWDRIEKKEERDYNDLVYDFTINNKDHNFISNGFVVSNCSVRLLKTNLKKSDIQEKSKLISKELYKAIPSGVGKGTKMKITKEELKEIMIKGAKWAVEKGYGKKQDYENTEESGCMSGADIKNVSDAAISRGINQLGSIGAGNHFLEIQYVNEIFDKKTAEAFGLEKDQAVIMIHCGSRGFGHQIASDYIQLMEKQYGFENLPDRQLIYAPINSELGKKYYSAMCAAANFAFCNKQILTHLTREAMKTLFPNFEAEVLYDVCHNIAKFEDHNINGKIKQVCVHRKGATRSYGPGKIELPKIYQKTGQPIIIPGSMGTSSYVLVGTKKAEELSFASTAHGAGRLMSRHEAIRTLKSENVKKDLEDKNIALTAGSWKSIVEEASQVYKNVDDVVKVSHDLGIGNMVAKLKPMVVIKG